jgi:hypothetical protein
VFIEELDDFGEVQQRSCKPVDFVYDDAIDEACFDVTEQFL